MDLPEAFTQTTEAGPTILTPGGGVFWMLDTEAIEPPWVGEYMTDAPTRPPMPTALDRKRAEHLGLRSRMLSGLWMPDLERALSRHISPDRRAVWGVPEMSRNPYRSITQQIGGILYSTPPVVRGPQGSEDLLANVGAAGWWQLAQRVSTDLVGLREVPVRVDYSERGGLLYRPMDPDRVVARSRPEAPDRPTCVEELQLRTNPELGGPEWVWEVIDIGDLDKPRHLILHADRKVDLTTIYTGKTSLSGDAYQYRDHEGRPYLPVAWYQAERTGRLWDSWYGVEAVLGSLTVGVLLTFWVHGVKDGSFSTVLLVNGQVSGLEITSAGSRSRTNVISTEPGSLIEIAPIEEGVQPSAIQLKPGMEPDKLIQAISSFEGGLAEYAGVSPADLLRTHADPRSGISLSISREGLRAAQARYVPQLRRGDLDLISITAKLLNRATGSSFAESGYSIAYPALPLSSAEMQSQREDVMAKIGAGLLSRVDAYMALHPGLTREQAMTELKRIARENTMFPGLTM